MNLASHFFQRLLKLDPPITRDLVIQRRLRVPMPDGAELLADRWAPRTGGDSLPVAGRVLTYTSGPLDSDTEIIGEVSAEIWFRSSLPHADVFVRLCDVDDSGRSWNVCDGLVSLTGADAITTATVRLWPTASRFKRGHRIRVQVSSGAFPRYARNPGTGEPRATATRPTRRSTATRPTRQRSSCPSPRRRSDRGGGWS
jgi:putative CocE/NonD family hydrolase